MIHLPAAHFIGGPRDGGTWFVGYPFLLTLWRGRYQKACVVRHAEDGSVCCAEYLWRETAPVPMSCPRCALPVYSDGICTAPWCEISVKEEAR